MAFKVDGTVETSITRESIALARRNRDHPVIETMDQMGTPYWNILRESLRSRTNPKEKHEIRWRAMVPFAEALRGREFTLGPLEIVSIWSKAMKTFQGNSLPNESVSLRHSLASAIVWSYVEDGMPQDWRSLFKRLREREGLSYLRSLVEQGGSDAERFFARRNEIEASIGALKAYADKPRTNNRFIFGVLENWNNGMVEMSLIAPPAKINENSTQQQTSPAVVYI